MPSDSTGQHRVKPLPRDLLARKTREMVEQRGWDSMPAFAPLHWDSGGGTLCCKRWYAIDPTINPEQYPSLLIGMARDTVMSEPGDPPRAFIFQGEAWVVTEPGADASPAERAAYDNDAANRTFHQRPDAEERAFARCADIHGRVWLAEKTRGREGITEHYWPSRSKDLPGGPLVPVLWAAAVTTGALAYGLPVNAGGRPFNVEVWLRDHVRES